MTRMTREHAEAQLVNVHGVTAGSTLYVRQTYRNRDGDRRHLRFYTDAACEHDVTELVAAIAGLTFRPGMSGARIDGGGMDMHFYAVYVTSRFLFAGQDDAGYKLTHRTVNA